ncbi:MAG TPA: FAD:protein FMN transferase, partial [Longimicrobiales bacterium]
MSTEGSRNGGSAADDTRSGSTRRKFLALGVGTFVVGSVVPRGLFGSKRQLVRRTVPIMGTIAEIGIVSADVARAQLAIDAALEELYRVNRTMTRFSPNSDIGRANLEAHRRPVEVSAATAQVVGEALRWSEGNAGRWDPAIGKVCALWDVKHRTTPPPADRVAQLAGRKLYQSVEVERRAGKPILYFRSADAGVDLGGIAKGWAVDRAIDAIR